MTRIDHFAEALSETGSVAQAAERIGISRDYGRCIYKRIRRKIGWQSA